MTRTSQLIAAASMVLMCHCTAPAPVVMPAPAPGTGPTARGRFGVYSAVLADFARRTHPQELLLEDSSFSASGLPFTRGLLADSVFGPDFRRHARLQRAIFAESLAAPVPIVLLGDSATSRSDWRPIYRVHRHASGMLRLSEPAFTPDSNRAALLLMVRCAPGLCGYMDYIELRRVAGTWTVSHRQGAGVF